MRLILAALALACCASASEAAEPSKAQTCASSARQQTAHAQALARQHKRWASWSKYERYAVEDASVRPLAWEKLSAQDVARETRAARLRLADDRDMARAYGLEAKNASGPARAAAFERQAFWSSMARIDAASTAFSSCMARAKP